MSIDQAWADVIAAEAVSRTQMHRALGHTTGCVPDRDLVGLFGEAKFAQEFGQPLDLASKPRGDQGHDFVVPLRMTIDIKTARKPSYLIQEQDRVTADIYVLAHHQDDPMQTSLLGWQWGRVLARQPTHDFGYGLASHYIDARQLRPMRELHDRIMRLR